MKAKPKNWKKEEMDRFLERPDELDKLGFSELQRKYINEAINAEIKLAAIWDDVPWTKK
jgi:hypothetical protein